MLGGRRSLGDDDGCAIQGVPVGEPGGGGDSDDGVRRRRWTVAITNVAFTDGGGDRDDRRADRDADADHREQRGGVYCADADASADSAASDPGGHHRGDPHEDRDPATQRQDGIY